MSPSSHSLVWCCTKVAENFSFTAADGVVLATEKKQKNQLFEEDTIVKVESVSKNIGMVYSGMGPDFR